MSIHFSEILLILIVAVLVIKPQHLPGLAFKIGTCLKRLREAASVIKKEIQAPHE